MIPALPVPDILILLSVSPPLLTDTHLSFDFEVISEEQPTAGACLGGDDCHLVFVCVCVCGKMCHSHGKRNLGWSSEEM